MKKYKYSTQITIDGKAFKVRADTLAELSEKIEAKKREARELLDRSGGNMRLKDWAEECVETYKVGQKPNTRKAFMYLLRHCILEQIGEMRLKDIRPIHCQKVLNAQAGNSKRQINEVYNQLQFLFRHATDNGLILRNPAVNLERPIGTKTSRRALTPYERRVLVKVIPTDPRFTFFALMLYAGCRPSEAEHVTGRDVEMVDGFRMLHIRGTKTAQSDRLVPIVPELWELIKNIPKDRLLATSAHGAPMTPSNRRHAWKALRRAMNLAMGCRVYRNQLVPPYPLAEDLVPYCLRHEYCTDLARRGVDIRIAQRLMGHADIKMTANIYTNLDRSDIVQAARMLVPVDTQVDTPKMEV